MAKDNRSLGRFILDGIAPAPRGLPQIDVKFDIDASGILTVVATDKATNKSQSIKIEGSIGLSKEEVEKMKKEAEINAVEDQKKKELIEARNMADNLIYASEKAIKDAEGKITEDLKKEIEEKINNLKKVKDSDNINDIKAKSEELSGIIQKIGEQVYKQPEAGNQANQDSGKEPPEAETEKEEKQN
jgi:molecular chaperone DnaK